jgi:hypothetical protein
VPITTVTLVDDAEKTITQTTDTALKSVSTSTVWKPGSAAFNAQALVARNQQAITDCNTAEGLINASGWDGLSPAQRKAISLGIVQAIRAQARLNLNQYDSPS